MNLPGGITIRAAEAGDLELIFITDPLSQSDPKHKEFIHSAVESGSCIVAFLDTLLGFAILDYSFFGSGFIPLLVVRPEHRRRGVGSALLQHIESNCTTEKLFTSTNESNLPMQALLEKLDYQPSGIIYGLDEGDPELVFRKDLRK